MIRYPFRVLVGIVVCWICAEFLIPATYPPRHMELTHWQFILVVTATVLLISDSKRPRRFIAYYSIVAGFPLIFAVWNMYRTRMDIQIMLGESPGVSIVFFPTFGIVAALVTSAVACDCMAMWFKKWTGWNTRQQTRPIPGETRHGIIFKIHNMKQKSIILIVAGVIILLYFGHRYIRLNQLLGRNTDVVFCAKVIDPDTSVSAGTNQTYVAYGQGWAAIKVEVHKVCKGSISNDVVWIENMANRGGLFGFDWWRYELDKNRKYCFAANRNDDLSKWCETEVFSLVDYY